MKTKHTTGKWIYNKEKHCIESDTEWAIEPNEEWELEGSKTEIISTYGAMGGNDTQADIKLICSAPELLKSLIEMVKTYEGFNGAGNANPNSPIYRAKKLIEETIT